ncbi:MAG: rhomboid family intramembrane serine protease [Lachnospiraceae bacterium]|nr:rhomboid family intramembrane serine protease [Lachnospiraceae bacterium]
MEEISSFVRSRQPVNLIIVLVNIIVFLVLCFLGDTGDIYFMVEHGASFAPLIAEGKEYYRLVTCMFLHFGAEHLFYNMLVLIFLGDVLEKEVGKLRYVLIYFAGGIAGNIVSVWFEYRAEKFAVSAGASGAIFAVIGALVWIVIRNKGRLEDYSGKRLLLMAGLSVAEGLTTSGVDNWAHIGGMAAGFMLAVLLYRKRRSTL